MKKEDTVESPAVSDQGWGRIAAGEASTGLKIEGADDAQCVGSIAERTNRLAEKEIKERLYKLHYRLCVAK